MYLRSRLKSIYGLVLFFIIIIIYSSRQYPLQPGKLNIKAC